MRKSWLITCFINFFIAALMGLLLRLLYVSPSETVKYQFLLHGHSHVAMLGWVYLIIYSLIVHFFIPKEAQQKPVYNRLFWLTEIAVIGMMFRFPAEGYALFSIVFSSLHIFCSYYFCRLIWKNAHTNSLPEKLLLRTSLFFMILSTMGVWCLGPTVRLLGKTSGFYQIAIQFFLHFQFNGWFLFAVLALFFHQLKVNIDEKQFRLFYNLLVTATILTLALPVSWYLPNPIFYWINSLGVVLQLISFIIFIQIIRPHFQTFFNTLRPIEKLIYGFTLTSLFLKIITQLIVLIPKFAQISHQIRNLVVGYIHLTMLGIITGFLFAILLNNSFLNKENNWVKCGIKLFIMSFILSELILFFQRIYFFLAKEQFPMYYQNLFITSIFLPISILMIIFSLFKGIIKSHKY